MVIGILQFDVHVPAGPHASLKDKRRVVKSIKDRLHREHMVSVAEVAHQGALNLARLAVVLVTGEGRHAGEVLDSIAHKVRTLAANAGAHLGDTDRQVIHASQLENLPGYEAPDGSSTGTLPGESDLADEMLRHFESPGEPGDGARS